MWRDGVNVGGTVTNEVNITDTPALYNYNPVSASRYSIYYPVILITYPVSSRTRLWNSSSMILSGRVVNYLDFNGSCLLIAVLMSLEFNIYAGLARLILGCCNLHRGLSGIRIFYSKAQFRGGWSVIESCINVLDSQTQAVRSPEVGE